MLRIHQQYLELTLQYVPHWFPVNTGRFHCYVRNPTFGKPLSHFQQLAGECSKPSFSFLVLPFSRRSTQAVIDFLCTSKPQQHRYRTSISSCLMPCCHGRYHLIRILIRVPFNDRRQQFVVPNSAPVILVASLRQTESASLAARHNANYPICLSLIFMLRCRALRGDLLES